jgi:hypothetical protein
MVRAAPVAPGAPASAVPTPVLAGAAVPVEARAPGLAVSAVPTPGAGAVAVESVVSADVVVRAEVTGHRSRLLSPEAAAISVPTIT